MSTWILVVFLAWPGSNGNNTRIVHSIPDWRSQTECRQAGDIITHKKSDSQYVCLEQKHERTKIAT